MMLKTVSEAKWLRLCSGLMTVLIMCFGNDLVFIWGLERLYLWVFSCWVSCSVWSLVGLKNYDLIVVGSGSVMEVVTVLEERQPGMRIAVIDKDEPGGICLTRGCIPSKILLYSAEMVRTIENAHEFGVNAEIKSVDFGAIMSRMRRLIGVEIEGMRQGLTHTPNLDYYNSVAEFIGPYTMKVEDEIITSRMIFLCAGSRPTIPLIKGLEQVRYQTSDTLLKMNTCPGSLVIIGGGYIAAEYGHFFSAMGSKVTIIGRNRQFVPEEEPEVSALAKKQLQDQMTILTNHEATSVENTSGGEINVVAVDRESGKQISMQAEEVLVASGRSPNTDLLHPERAGIETDEEGWIKIDEYLESSQPNIWVLGDADGRYMFKHVANYEALIVYYNAVLRNKVKADYHAVPSAVFTDPEIASVGMKEQEAIQKYGKDNLLIGVQRYQDTAKGLAMNIKDCFVKIIIESTSNRILGAHIVGPYASVLIQEVVNLMYTPGQSVEPIAEAMHIHPSLSEVVQRAVAERAPVDQYHHMLTEHYGLSTE